MFAYLSEVTSALWEVHIFPLVEWPIYVLLVDVLDHGLIVVTTKLLVVIVNLHPGSPPGSPGCHLDTFFYSCSVTLNTVLSLSLTQPPEVHSLHPGSPPGSPG